MKQKNNPLGVPANPGLAAAGEVGRAGAVAVRWPRIPIRRACQPSG